MAISLNSLNGYETGAADWASIGKRARSAREAVGYSIEDLAVTCGLAHSEINAIEDGQDSDQGRLARIAAALQISLGQLLGTPA